MPSPLHYGGAAVADIYLGVLQHPYSFFYALGNIWGILLVGLGVIERSRAFSRTIGLSEKLWF